MKLELSFDSMPRHQREFLCQFVPDEFEGNFSKLIHNQRDQIKVRIVGDSQQALEDQNLDLGWIGTRLEVELPQSEGFKLKKNIVPEMINQKFMWIEDYFHYKDWEKAQKEVYDGFNLLAVPRKEGEFKYFYDRGNHQRIVPQGIFPPANYKRVILEPPAYKFAKELTESTQKGNELIN